MTGNVSSSLEASWSAFMSPRPSMLHICGDEGIGLPPCWAHQSLGVMGLLNTADSPLKVWALGPTHGVGLCNCSFSILWANMATLSDPLTSQVSHLHAFPLRTVVLCEQPCVLLQIGVRHLVDACSGGGRHMYYMHVLEVDMGMGQVSITVF